MQTSRTRASFRRFSRALLSLCVSSLPTGVSSALAGTQATYYVDPVNGSDTYSGTSPQNAFRTLPKAKTTVRSINANMTGDIVVYLRNGTYALTTTLVFAAADSGTNGYSVIYQGYSNESPVISGGRNLSGGWILHDASKNIYRKNNVSGTFRELLVNDRWAIRARQPNLTNDGSGGDFYRYTQTYYPYRVPSSYVGSWANAGTAEMVWTNMWTQPHARIASATPAGSETTLNFKSPENEFALDHEAIIGPGLCYFDNTYDFLDAPGEWFLNRTTHVLYYIPRTSETMATATVTAPRIATLLEIAGTSSNPVQHLQFRGLAFANTGWTAPDSYGYVDGQGGFLYQTQRDPRTDPPPTRGLLGTFSPIPGMVNIRYANNILFLQNQFTRGGTWGIVESGNTDHNTYLGNSFSYLGAGGICIGNLPSPGGFYELPSGAGDHDVVRSNLFDHVAQQYRGAVPILAGNVKYVDISFNEIRGAPYSGISLGWRWDDDPRGDSHHNRVAFNRIHNVMELLIDGAGIYTLGRMDDTFIDHNFVYNVLCGPICVETPGYVFGIYLDNGSANKTVSNNVTDNTGAFLNFNVGARDNSVYNNYYNSTLGVLGPGCPSCAGGSTVFNNVSTHGTVWPEAAIDIMDWSGVEVSYMSVGAVSRGSNVAIGGGASASSTYSPGFAASYAVDNDTETGLWASDGMEANPWWRVDLGGSYQVFEVDVEARQDLDQPLTRSNFEIGVYDPGLLSWSWVASVGGGPAFYHRGVYPAWFGRFSPVGAVRVGRTNNAGHFNFAEVKVFGLPLAPADVKAGWSFDGNGTDFSGHGFGATLYGAFYNTMDRKDGTASLWVNGGGYAGAALVSTATDNVTLSAWANWDGTSGDELVLYNGHSGYNGYGILLWSGNAMKLSVLCGGVNFLNSTVSLPVNRWTHLAAVRRNGTWELWVNGTITWLANSTTAPNVPNGATLVGPGFAGSIDNTRIYERALSVGELQALAMQ